MNLPRFLLLIALAAAGLFAGASSAGAAATPKITTKFTYKVELKGTQTTSWTLNHVGAGPESCDMDQTGQGKETIRFSGRPTIMRTYDGLSQPTFFTGKGEAVTQLEMPLRGTINRQGSVFTQPLPPDSDNCPDGVPTAPPTPDCGTKQIKKLVVRPEYEFKKDTIVLSQADAAQDPFKFCPGGGSAWPYLLKQDSAGRTITQQLPYKDLFEQGQNIIIATGVEKQTTGDIQWTTKLRWVLDFKLVKKEDLTQAK